jgi:predicted amidohydrolase
MSLTITLVQSDLVWEDKSANIRQFEQKLQTVMDTDIVVLPEMFTTGFTMNTALAETMQGPTVGWMQHMAQKNQTVICGSIIIQEGTVFYNRFLWVQPNDVVHYYDKKHLFSMAGEDHSFESGQQQVVVEYKGWKCALFVCYDLRFPVWNRNHLPYDVAFYVANWPAKRALHWNSLLLARAIENQSYIVAVNRVGQDGKGFEYQGDSSVIDPGGNYLYHRQNIEEIYAVEFTKEQLAAKRKEFPFLQDRDSFQLL